MFKIDLTPPDTGRPFDQGQEAAILHVPESDNPYGQSTTEHAEWKAGYEAGIAVIRYPGGEGR